MIGNRFQLVDEFQARYIILNILLKRPITDITPANISLLCLSQSVSHSYLVACGYSG
jgi:hypothetical protein